MKVLDIDISINELLKRYQKMWNMSCFYRRVTSYQTLIIARNNNDKITELFTFTESSWVDNSEKNFVEYLRLKKKIKEDVLFISTRDLYLL